MDIRAKNIGKRKSKWPMGCPAPPVCFMSHPGTCSGPPVAIPNNSQGSSRDLPGPSQTLPGASRSSPELVTSQQPPGSSHQPTATSLQ